MTAYRPRPLLSAIVGPRAALVLMREFGRQLESYADAMAASSDDTSRAVAGEIRSALDSMAESARLWRERSGEDEPGSGSGTAELPQVSGGASSVVSSSDRLTTEEVADRWKCSREWVSKLCRDERLVGHLTGGTWLIEEESVLDYEQTRRQAS